ncbi:uncharacterized protein LOC112905996 [Agrilus planipennis]|nr:uncharacterized protein LOC112905995 [Agrilus planipennis]XP_025835288.1 uncharacterized protein LOC112905996 [Agrilus planipennis]
MSYGTIISFQGKLHNKKLVRPNSSRTQSTNVAGFGTPGLDTHVLEFNCKDGQQFILYLNNWERNAKPLGLIPEMEILVRDVAVQSNRYYKSTVFTDFEVKDYGRNVILNSVHLDPQENMPSRKINDASFFVETINSLKDSRDVVLNSDQATANLKEEKSHSEGISASKENSSNSKNRKTDCGSGTRFAEVLDMLQSISSSKVRRKEKNSTPLNSENYNSHELKAKSYGTIIPFQEKLHNKKLVRPNSSTTQSANIAGFRTSSLFTHVLVFNCKDEQEFNVYLNYWDRNSDPLSLIPEIKTLVRDVAVQSNRYYKSTALTDFEVKVDGRNIILIPVNLPPQENIKIGIDRPTFLGYGHKLPERITIFARFSEIEIRSLRIKISCSNCLTIYCSCGNADITVNLMCFVFDGFGKAVLIANDLEFLRLVLHISQYSWNSWCKGFKLYGPFNYNGQCSPEETGVHDRDMFAKKLYTLITIINRGVTNSYSINVKCRKIVRKHDPQHEYLPMFYCLKARRSSRHQ